MDKYLETDIKDQQILQLLANTFLSVREISQRLFLSESTVRRRLSKLEKQNLIIRTHGGAVLNQNQQIYKNIPIYLRTTQLSDEKKFIAKKAAELISDGDTIFIDSSSTVLYLVPHLSAFKSITVCTNSLKAATILAEMEISCIFLGGDVISGEQACNSEETYEMISKINADLFFFSCDALSDNGILTDNSKRSCYLRRKFMQNSKTTVLLLDNTKVNKECTHTLCSLNDIDYFICDKDLSEYLLNLESKDVRAK